jgi:hypothetical protein
MLSSDILTKLDKLYLSTKFAIKNMNTGKRRSIKQGESVEFSDYKEYMQGDDFRKIDWNLFARFEKLYIKKFLEERRLVINIFLDNSKSMNFYVEKERISKDISLVFTYIGIKNLDKINIFIIDNNSIKLMDSLDSKFKFSELNNNIEKIDYCDGSIFKSIPKRKYEKGISMIISDFLDDDVFDAIKYLGYEKQEIILIQTLQNEEINPSLAGDLKLIDSEIGEYKEVSINEKIIKDYKINLEKHIESINTEVKKYRGFHKLINVNKGIEEIIFNDLVKENVLR